MNDRISADQSTLTSVPVDALLIIDMQNGFLKDQKDLILKVGQLVSAFPAECTWWLKYRNYPDSPFIKRLHWSDVMVSPQTDIVEPLLPLALNVVEHESYDPPEEMAEMLRGCRYVAIAGTDTDACIYAAAFFLWRHRMFPIILRDHCGSSGGQNFHRPALDMIRRQFGVDAIASSVTPSSFALERAKQKSVQIVTPS